MSQKLEDLSDSQKIERNTESFNFRKLLLEGISNFANDLNKNIDKGVSEEIKVVIFEAVFKECLGDVVESLKWSKGYIKNSKRPP
ncbi:MULTISPECIES: hypothetical protein [unclassified Spirosoma]|uniref:hypothetical protein n=1 Tax=unclassified Spirosoma TaxID=2621999 RepID=UPI000964D4E9|nr:MULTISPECIES: hypothetical protein [unclassified Spirosoma]MBN8825837.1 hypothetical protein [Spirosoma sp.]OJW70535.1 MAG: hypothetical protein BGO59_25210 [Spirosoma sp. 48-14]